VFREKLDKQLESMCSEKKITMMDKMMQGMKKNMMSCEEASFYISKNLDTDIGFRKKMSLRMHVIMCKYCMRFEKELNFISKKIQQFTSGKENTAPSHTLSDEKKDKLQQLIEEKL
jgi:hypothetical protein